MSFDPAEKSAATTGCGSDGGPLLTCACGCLGLPAPAYFALAAAVCSQDGEGLPARLKAFLVGSPRQGRCVPVQKRDKRLTFGSGQS